MFLEIKSDLDIFYAPHCEGHTLDLTYPKQVSNSFLLNLNHVQQVYFGRLQPIELSVRKEQAWMDLNGTNYIGFYIPSGLGSDSFSLFFKDGAIGEFQRIKRLIEELIKPA